MHYKVAPDNERNQVSVKSQVRTLKKCTKWSRPSLDRLSRCFQCLV